MYDDELDGLVRGVARQVQRRYRMVEVDDLVQEAWLWLYNHQSTIEEWTADERAQEGRWLQQTFTKSIGKVMQRAARREKASAAGYEVQDEAFYSIPVIEEALRGVFDQDYFETGPERESHEIRSKHDASISPEWPVHVMDVRRAMKHTRMSVRQRSMLAMRYGEHRPLAIVAAVHELGIPETDSEIKQGLYLIARFLGGAVPMPCERGCASCANSASA